MPEVGAVCANAYDPADRRPLDGAIAAHGLDLTGCAYDYAMHFHRIDPLSEDAFKRRHRAPLYVANRSPIRKNLIKSEFYNDFLKPRKLFHDVAAINVDLSDGSMACLNIYPAWAAPPLSATAVTAFSAQAQTIESLLRLRHEGMRMSVDAAFANAIAAEGGPAVLVDCRRRVVRATEGFDAGGRRRVWTAYDGVLALADAAADRALWMYCRTAGDNFRGAAAVVPQPLCLPVAHGEVELRPLAVLGDRWASVRRFVLVRLKEVIEIDPSRARRRLRRAGLTIAEAEMAFQYARGPAAVVGAPMAPGAAMAGAMVKLGCETPEDFLRKVIFLTA